MDWKKGIGFGLAIWVLMFVIVSIFIRFGIYELQAMMIITPIISGVIAYILAGLVKPQNYMAALQYALTWLVVGVILDALITMGYNPAIFSSLYLWLGYILMVLAVFLRVKKA